MHSSRERKPRGRSRLILELLAARKNSEGKEKGETPDNKTSPEESSVEDGASLFYYK